MLEFGLSLIGFETVSQIQLSTIRNAGYTSITVVPSQLGFSTSLGQYQDSADLFISQITEAGLRIHSLQGLLFGLEPGISENKLFAANERLKELARLASDCNVKYLILGAPNFRQDKRCWDQILSFAGKHQKEYGVEFVVENICNEKSGKSAHLPWSNISEEPKIKKMLDIGNALECSHKYPMLKHSTHDLDFCQISSRYHKFPEDLADILEMTSALRMQPKIKLAIWEIMGEKLSDVCSELPNHQKMILKQFNGKI